MLLKALYILKLVSPNSFVKNNTNIMRLLNKISVIIWFILICLIIYLISGRFDTFKLTPKLGSYDSDVVHFKGNNLFILKPNSQRNITYYQLHAAQEQIDVENAHTFTSSKRKLSPIEGIRGRHNVVLCVVACGDRLHETLVMIKSAILFSNNVSLRVVVIADYPLIKGFDEKLGEWMSLLNNSFVYEVHPVSFPENGKDDWRKLFKPCASQRLFLPSLLKDIDSVLYVDTDTLFLEPLEEIWVHFFYMNSSQMAALSPEHEDPNTGWYNRFARHPYYGELGVNSGVMLMNLTRMRQFGWEKYLSPIYKEFRLKITWGDQDIINIIFHYHPERLYIYSCRYNYRSDHCMYMSVCEEANKHGVAVIHGSRSTFHGDKQPAFKAIFSSMEEYQLGSDPYENLLLPLESGLDQTTHTNCGKVRGLLTKNLHKYISVKEPFR